MSEVRHTIWLMDGEPSTLARLLCCTGMRIRAGMHPRTKDVDFERGAIIVRKAKGGNDHVVMLPHSLRDEWRQLLRLSHAIWQADRAAKLPGIEMPHALAARYPRAGKGWAWRCVFPQAPTATDPQTGARRRHHACAQTFRRALTQALRSAGVTRPATALTLRHSFATHVLRSGADIRTVHTSPGYADVTATRICSHVLKIAGGAPSPMDRLDFDALLRHRDESVLARLDATVL